MARPSWLLAIAMSGDGLLYALLPLMPEAFGISLAWAGLLLAANRLVRIFAYTHVARLTAHLGARRAGTIAAVGAIVSTAVFAFEAPEWVQLAARFLWGLSFGAMNLVTFAYAASVPEQAGRRIGTSRAVAGVAITITLLAGCFAVDWIGTNILFTIMTILSLACLPLALSLEPIDIRPPRHRALLMPRPGRIDVWAAAQGFVVDGVFLVSVTLLLKASVTDFSPAVATGIVFSLRWIVESFCAPIGGHLADRFGATRVMLVFGLLSSMALGSIAFGFVYAGAVAVTVIRGLTNTIASAMVAERSPGDSVGAQSVYSTYRDIGAAVGPLVAGIFIDEIATLPLYLALSLILGGTTLMLRRWR